MPLPRQLIRPFILSLVAAIILYAVAIFAGDIQSVGDAAKAPGITGWLIILGLSLVNYGLRFIRWQAYLKQLLYKIPVRRHLAYYLAGFAFTTTPGKVGEAVRSVYLRRYRVTYHHSLSAFFVERLIDVVTITLLALFAAYSMQEARWTVAVIGILVIVCLPLIHTRIPHRLLGLLATRAKSGKVKTFGAHLSDMLDASASLLKSGPLYAGLALGLVAWGAEGYAFYLILEYLDASIPIMLAVGIYSVSILVGAASFIPGGLGSTEASMILLLGLVGLDTPTAIAATLICRIATLWFAVGIGLLAVGGLQVNGDSLADIGTARIFRKEQAGDKGV